jgi:tetratricopeptide (TPR) repeat protein
MKSLTLAAGIAALALPLTAAEAGIITIGEGFARSCYESSEAHVATPAAIEACNRAFSEQALDFHDEVATHVNRGILYYLSGNLRLANLDYDAALALDPREPEAWLNKGMAALKARDSAAAAPMFEKALELKTVRPALAYYGRAIVHEDTGNVRQAYADLQRARELEPRWPLPAEELKRFVVRE